MATWTLVVKFRQAAGAGIVLAAVIGALTLVALLGTMFSHRRRSERGWKLVARDSLFLFCRSVSTKHACTSYHSWSCFHLSSGLCPRHTPYFPLDTLHAISFRMGMVAWCMHLAVGLSAALSVLFRYGYKRLD